MLSLSHVVTENGSTSALGGVCVLPVLPGQVQQNPKGFNLWINDLLLPLQVIYCPPCQTLLLCLGFSHKHTLCKDTSQTFMLYPDFEL